MSKVPAELYIERPSIHNDIKWSWEVYQPDSHGGVWESGSHWHKETAERDARAALREVHRQQGLLEDL